jgi:predicted transcriptional regulator
MSVSVRISDKSNKLLREIAKKNTLFGSSETITNLAIEEFYDRVKKKKFGLGR